MIDESGTLRLGTLEVHRLGFGSMQLTGTGVWGPPSDHDGAIRVLRRAVELGVDLIDTADSYGPDVAEELIREALHPYPPALRIATKAGFTRPGPGVWEECGRPDYLRQQCEGSLRRLGVDRIDLFQLHRIDPAVDPDEQFGALKELRDEGKVAEVGLSEVSVAETEAALRIVPVVSVQNQYNIAQRGADDVVDFCEARGIGFIPWVPLGSGRLARPGGPIDRVAGELGASVPQVGLAWLLRRSPVMLPIPGTSSVEHLEENCAAAGLTLTDAQFQELSEARKPLRRWALSG
jgi:aryl-alcohol dehydrogenase-like predicted oxidoreductase